MEYPSGLYGFGLPFLIILTILVFVHELGHYLIARRYGVRIEVFSIGFGPELFGWNDKHGTRWKFSIIPLGGYVKMFGDANAASMPGDGLEEMSEAERARAFQSKTLSQRSWIVAGGPLANFLFAIVLLTGLFATAGQQFTPPVVGQVLSDSAADAAGMLAADRVIDIDGTAIERFEDIQRIVQLSAGKPLSLTVLRDGREVVLAVTPERVTDKDVFGNEQELGRLGIARSGVELVQHSPHMAAYYAVKETFVVSGTIIKVVFQLITGNRSLEGLRGPLGIAQMSGQIAEFGVVPVLGFMAMLSINLGLINLFPIPMLDGGHLLYYAIEALRGRPLGERAQEFGFRVGMALVLMLVVFVTWNDLVHIRVVDFVKSLIG